MTSDSRDEIRRLLNRYVGISQKIERDIVDEELAGLSAHQGPGGGGRHLRLKLQGQSGKPLSVPLAV